MYKTLNSEALLRPFSSKLNEHSVGLHLCRFSFLQTCSRFNALAAQGKNYENPRLGKQIGNNKDRRPVIADTRNPFEISWWIITLHNEAPKNELIYLSPGEKYGA